LLIAPYYNNPEPAGFREHYERVADAVDLPQIVYNVPSRTGRSMTPETVVSLAEHPNVAGYKAASGDLALISGVVERTPDDFAVLSGDDPLTLPILSVGGVGAISVVANVEPARVSRLVGAWLAGDPETARELHHELGPLTRALFAETNPIGVKEALHHRGHVAPRLRPPLTRMGASNRERLAERLDTLDPIDEGAGGDPPAPAADSAAGGRR
jgi:4-hydroxy-tetrahydrodipicolinate synthase